MSAMMMSALPTVAAAAAAAATRGGARKNVQSRRTILSRSNSTTAAAPPSLAASPPLLRAVFAVDSRRVAVITAAVSSSTTLADPTATTTTDASQDAQNNIAFTTKIAGDGDVSEEKVVYEAVMYTFAEDGTAIGRTDVTRQSATLLEPATPAAAPAAPAKEQQRQETIPAPIVFEPSQAVAAASDSPDFFGEPLSTGNSAYSADEVLCMMYGVDQDKVGAVQVEVS
jgi:hypothetical protein